MKRQFSGQQLIVYLFASMLIITLICLSTASIKFCKPASMSIPVWGCAA